MRWIRLYHLFYHSTAGCCATSQNIKFRGTKIPPKVSSPLCTASPTYNQTSVERYFWTYLMRWISLWCPFVHSSPGSFATSQNIKFRGTKMSPKSGGIFTLLYTISNLQSEKLPGIFLDLFDALNPPVASVCQWLPWLLSNKQKHSRVKNSGQYFHPSIRQHQSTIRNATNGVSEPIWCTEFGCCLHLSIALLVVEI